MKFQAVITLIIVTSAIQHFHAARILGIFWFGSESHFRAFQILLKALTARGHDVVVVSHFPLSNPMENYTDISVFCSMPSLHNVLNVSANQDIDNTVQFPLFMFEHNTESCEMVFKHQNIGTLLKSDEKFDLIINEIFGCDCCLGFVHKFNAPHIALVSCVLFPWVNDRTANPDNPAYIPSYFTEYTDRMSFWERLMNVLHNEVVKWWYYYYSELPTYRINSKYFGDDLPHLSVIARNVSLILVNSHFSINQLRPTVPAVVEVGGLHIQRPNKLPQVCTLHRDCFIYDG
jgi:glucuronosyltransferase